MKHTEFSEARVCFLLPDWFSEHERHSWQRVRRYPKGHRYESQVEDNITENNAVDALFRLKGVKEVCHHPQAKWVLVAFNCKPRYLAKQVLQFQAKLERFIGRYKEARQPIEGDSK
jgi:hypothetical protein